ncbi:MAG: glucose-1-phosphate adenylyltransferase subunit GlgD [Eubacteriales bacterium]|nr:glucose-1-phosphate adenylyltransferase subunit GlgD [Eubacteriales bacterium]
MISKAIGLILADDPKILLGELTRPRALSAIPFGGRYRLIDFNLSNMVHSGINTIGISTFTKYKSLMDHLGTGSPWDLDRKNQGLSILAPYISTDTYTGEADDLLAILHFFRHASQEYMVITRSDVLMTMTYNDMIRAHEESDADITVLFNRDGSEGGEPNLILDMDRQLRVKSVYQNPARPVSDYRSLGVIVIRRQRFVDLISEGISRGLNVFTLAYLLRQCDHLDVRGFEYRAPVMYINDIASYFRSTMLSLEERYQEALYHGSCPVYTKVKDEAPTIYTADAYVQDSMISDGCLIDGEIRHSMLFRGVTVAKSARLKNCIVFQNTYISEACELENVIIDKNCIIRPGIKLIGQEQYPMVIGKGAIV